jgi:hypothetical protein
MNLRRGKWLLSKTAQGLVLGLLVSWLGAQVNESTPLIGYPEDWTHHRIKFTLQGLQDHPEIASREPRAIHQLYRQWRAYQSPLAVMGINSGSRGAETTAQPAGHPDWSVPLGGGVVAFGQFPAKYTLDPTAAPSCTDYIVFALNIAAAAGGQANLVAFNNLYSGATGTPMCPGGGPTLKFAYATSTQGNGLNRTSPVLSLDGKKIAFVESHAMQGAGNPAKSYLHILTIGTTGSNGTSVTTAVSPGVGNNAVNISILYANATTTRSSPWIDYHNDIIYVCSDDGRLYKFTGAFKGTPALVSSGGWPVSVNANSIMTGPVFDDTTGAGVMYLADNNGNAYAVENIRAVAPAVPGPVHARTVGTGGAAGNAGIFDAPIFDVTGKRIFVSTANGIADNSVQGAMVALLDDTPNSLNISRKINIGAGATAPGGGGNPIYDGDFDNTYYNSATGTGHMLVCGTGPTTAAPYLYNLPIINGSPQQGGTPTSLAGGATNSRCGPVTEYFNPNINGGTDFQMFGVTSNCGITGAASSGCVISFQNGTTTVKAVESGGTSGIIIDNDLFTGDPGGQTSSFYFSTEGGTRSAVKLTQLGLK